ncbi:MAG: hypothetical protein R3C68_19075, partial [Myxococcota bacterium]
MFNRSANMSAFAAVFSLCCGSALGAPKVLLMPLVPLKGDITQDELQEVTQVLRQEMARRYEFSLLSTDLGNAATLREETHSGHPTAAYKRAMILLSRGRKASERLRFEDAIAALRQSRLLLAQSLEQIDRDDYDVLIDVHLLLAVAYLRAGKDAEGN